MSQSISLQSRIPQTCFQQIESNPRQTANGNDSWFNTAGKCAVVAIGILSAIGSFSYLPLGAALLSSIVILLASKAMFSCFSRSNPSGQNNQALQPTPTIPWHSRIFSNLSGFAREMGNVPIGGGGTVPIGGGHMGRGRGTVPPGANIPIGGGHAGRGRGLPPGGRGNVPIGGGPIGGGGGGRGNVPIGGGGRGNVPIG
jgi:hypothetical protein